MKDQEIIEANKLIDKFYTGRNVANFINGQCMFRSNSESGYENCYELTPVEHLKYHISYGDLMPVIEKIRKMKVVSYVGFDLDENGGYAEIQHTDLRDENCIKVHNEEPINGLYNAVVQFIEWYNVQNLNP